MANKHDIDYKEWYLDEAASREELEDFLDDVDFHWTDAKKAWLKQKEEYDRLYAEYRELSSSIIDKQFSGSRNLKTAKFIVTYDFKKNKIIKVSNGSRKS